MFHVTDVKTGICPLCRGTKERELFVVRGDGFTGDVCGRHLFILMERQPRKLAPVHNGEPVPQGEGAST